MLHGAAANAQCGWQYLTPLALVTEELEATPQLLRIDFFVTILVEPLEHALQILKLLRDEQSA